MSDPWIERREIGPAVLFLGDALALCRTGCMVGDAIVTDPRYGLNYTPDGRKQVANDSRRLWARLLRRLPDALLDTTADRLALFTRWDVWSQIEAAIGAVFPAQNCAIWDKNDNGRGNCNHIGNAHEMIWLSMPAQHVQRISGRRPHNILRHKKVVPLHHPTEKPVPLLCDLVEIMSHPGEIVVDLFMGSAPCGIAALTLGRRYIGAELDAEHFRTACDRIGRAWHDLSNGADAGSAPDAD